MEILDQYQNPEHRRYETPITVGQWMLYLFVTYLPIIGIVMLFVWAFGDSSQKNRANWAKAQLLWRIIGFAFVVVIALAFWGVIAAALLSIR